MKRFLEFSGGLGDILYDCQRFQHYASLETLQPGDEAIVSILSSNPFVKELFTWHRHAAQINVADYGYQENWDRQKYGLMKPDGTDGRKHCLRFYPSPADRVILDTIKRPYVVIQAGAGIDDRTFPLKLYASVVLNTSARIHAVQVGRTFDNVKGSNTFVRPEPILLGGIPRFTSLVDRLSVPGTIELIRDAVAVVSAYTSMLIPAWNMGKRVYALYPEIFRPDFERNHYATFGREYPGCRHDRFEDFSVHKYRDFLEGALCTL